MLHLVDWLHLLEAEDGHTQGPRVQIMNGSFPLKVAAPRYHAGRLVLLVELEL